MEQQDLNLLDKCDMALFDVLENSDAYPFSEKEWQIINKAWGLIRDLSRKDFIAIHPNCNEIYISKNKPSFISEKDYNNHR
jgi:hypothetical protein